jgi:hypothetical protein
MLGATLAQAPMVYLFLCQCYRKLIVDKVDQFTAVQIPRSDPCLIYPQALGAEKAYFASY